MVTLTVGTIAIMGVVPSEGHSNEASIVDCYNYEKATRHNWTDV